MPDVHAKLSASGAKRWMTCTPSVQFESQFEDKETEYAKEGTLAHSIAELILRYNNGEFTKRTFQSRLKKLQSDPLYKDEMMKYCGDYAQTVWETFNEVKKSCEDAEIMFEQRLDFSAWVEDGFGTGDVVIIADGCANIIDLKYGKGIGVSAINNPQLRLYGLGTLDTYGFIYDIDRIKMTIIQPRLEHTDSEELTASELVGWAETEVKPKAQLAYEGKGEYVSGDHCRFCKGRAVCRKRAEDNLEIAKYEFSEPNTLNPAEISDILGRADKFLKWFDHVKEYALDAAVNKGIAFPGWKVVEGRSTRKYKDETEVVKCLIEHGYSEKEIYNTKLKGITEITKLIGSSNVDGFLAPHIIKPQGAPTLAPESDKRPVFKSAESAKADFSDDLLD